MLLPTSSAAQTPDRKDAKPSWIDRFTKTLVQQFRAKLLARMGNWLGREHAKRIMTFPSRESLAGRRDRALLAVLISCGRRRAELLRIQVEDIQQREGRRVLPDMIGKGNRVRTVMLPDSGKARIDIWLQAAQIESGMVMKRRSPPNLSRRTSAYLTDGAFLKCSGSVEVG